MTQEQKQILIAPSGSLRDIDKTNLRKAGILIVETDSPSDVRLIQAESIPVSLPKGALMRAMGCALLASPSAQTAFAVSVGQELSNTKDTPQ